MDWEEGYVEELSANPTYSTPANRNRRQRDPGAPQPRGPRARRTGGRPVPYRGIRTVPAAQVDREVIDLTHDDQDDWQLNLRLSAAEIREIVDLMDDWEEEQLFQGRYPAAPAA